MRNLLHALLLSLPLASLGCFSSTPWAQAYPNKPIVIENRPGAAAILGAKAAADSAADGYTLFMADNGTFVFHTAIT